MSNIKHDFIFSFKDLQRSPAFVASIVLTLGLTLGALIIAFNVNYLMFFKPLPYGSDAQIYNVIKMDDALEPSQRNGRSYPGIEHLYRNQQSLDDAAAVTASIEIATNFNGHPQINALYTTHEFFDLFSADMALGRGFDSHVQLEPTTPVAVLSYSAWMNYYGGDKNVLNEKLVIKDVSFSIIGVTAKHFVQPELFGNLLKADVIFPWDFNATLPTKRDRWDYSTDQWQLLGRLKSDMDVNLADHSMSKLLHAEFSETEPGRTFFKDQIAGVDLIPFDQYLRDGSEDEARYILAGAIALILVATTNLINLFLSRAAEKQRNLSLRVALGARKKHIFFMLLSESLLLMLGAFLFAVLLTIMGMEAVKLYAANYIPRSEELGFSLVTIALSLSVCVVFAFIFAGVSSYLIKYRQLQLALQSSGKGSGLQISKRVRFFLVACQVFVVTAILSVNTNIFEAGVRTLSQPLAFKGENLHVLQLTNSTVPLSHDEIKDKIYVIKDVLEKNIIGMDGVSATFNNPLSTRFNVGVNIQAGPDGAFGANAARIDEDTIDVKQLPLISGRGFTADEIRDQVKVVVVSKMLAESLYPNEDPIGKSAYLHWDAEPFQIVGVAKDMPVYSDTRNDNDIYLTLRFDRFMYLMRFENREAPSHEDINALLKENGIDHKVFEYEPMSTYYDEEVQQSMFVTGFVLSLSVIAVILAGLGIYGVLSYSIALRKFELGVRMAIGAKSKDIIALVVKDETKPVFAGIALSICLVIGVYLGARQYVEVLSDFSVVPMLMTLVLVLLTVAVSIFTPLYSLLKLWPEKILKRQD